jgi:hypothetical protein
MPRLVKIAHVFAGDKIRHMTKIWHAGWAMKEVGWG